MTEKKDDDACEFVMKSRQVCSERRAAGRGDGRDR